jgi:hypothetical protein
MIGGHVIADEATQRANREAFERFAAEREAERAGKKAEKAALNQRVSAVEAAVTALSPVVFDLITPLPLMIGIHAPLLERLAGEHTAADVSAFLRRWCSRRPYVAAIAAGKHRHDLDGVPRGAPTDEQRAGAAKGLETAGETLGRRKRVYEKSANG